MAIGPFVSLHNHTEVGSPQDGMNDVDELFKRAKDVDHPAIAITDHGTMAAHYDAWEASKKTGVKLIPGVEFYFNPDLSNKKGNRHMVLLPINENGYQNILRLNYESYKNPSFGFMQKIYPRISWEHLEKFGKDIVCLTACSNGLIAKTLIAEDNEELAICHLKRLRSIFGDRLFLEIQPHVLKTEDGNVDQVRLNEWLVGYANDNDMDYVATCDAHYLDKEHAKYHDLMLAVKDKKAVDDPNRFRYGTQEMYLKNYREIIDFFGYDVAKKAMKNSIKISNMCEEPSYLESRGTILPHYPVKEEKDYSVFIDWKDKNAPTVKEDKAYLRYKVVEGFDKMKEDLDQKDKKIYWERIIKELSVLESRDFSSYMLIVSDYTRWAKENKVATGPARGSAAGSLVAKLIGITSVDPIKYDLLFERFHNKEKESFPDIDSDFSDPSKVKEYLRYKYGEDRVASISNWGKTTPKVVIKDVARSLRLGGDKSTAFKIANAITDIMPDTKTIEKAMEESAEFASYMEQYPELYEYASKLQNLTRNWSTHAAGVVIADRPLYEIVPLRIDKDGNVIVQWEKGRCEKFGLVKMDILGLKTLVVMEDTFKNILDMVGKEINEDVIPLDDPETFKLISDGDTAGVFQLESSMTPLCQKIRPSTIEEVADINALGRPSCSANDRRSYIRRKAGVEDVTYRHHTLERALKDTFGISLYEESMMTIAKDSANWDLDKADALRKITKLKGKDPELVLKTKSEFIRDSMSHSGMSYDKASEVWKFEIEPYGQYGFNKSHSISYSHISVQTAWLKRHYPSEYMCALINSEDPNSDKAQEYLSECKNMGIKILSPDINDSDWKYTVSEDGSIRTGLMAVKGLGAKAIDNIAENKPYSGMADFFYKTNSRVVQKTVIRSLAKSGALDGFGRTRKDIFENYVKLRNKVNSSVKKDIAIEDIEFKPSEEEWERKDLLWAEHEALGRTISGSLHEVFEGFFSNNSMVTKLSVAKELPKKTRIKVEVIIKNKLKELKVKKKTSPKCGRKFAKYLVEDVNGVTSELTVWPDEYDIYRNKFSDGIPIKAICSVDEYMEQKSLSLSEIESIYGN